MSDERIVVRAGDQERSFSFGDMLAFHAGNSPGGVAHAFKVLQRALPLLDPDGPAERTQISIETPFNGPGARDAFELVTGAVSDDRFTVKPELARPELGRARERFVFRLRYRQKTVTLALRDGFVTDEFIDLARTENRTAQQEARLDQLKQEMATAVISTAAPAVYEVLDPPSRDKPSGVNQAA